MEVYETSGVMAYMDEDGDLHLHYPITKAENVEGLEDVVIVNKIIGSGPPTASVKGKVGQTYYDKLNETTYTCTAVTTEEGVTTYTWQKSGATKASEISTGSGQSQTTLEAKLAAIDNAVEAATPKSGSGAPTSSTKGAVGQTYTDTATGTVYTCIAVTTESGVTTYTWEATGGSGAGSSLVLNRVYIDTAPTKVAYKAGEAFNPAGMVVKADYTLDGVPMVSGNVETEYDYPTEALAAGTANVTISLTKNGVTKTVTQAITVTKTQVPVPTYPGNLTYNTNTQYPSFNNEPSAALATKGGDLSGLNAGNYATTFVLNDTDLYEWASTFSGSVTWSIAKKAPSISASPNAVTLDTSHLTATATLSGAN